jgi:NAD(P)-dependent dehydrogenase (short-subunit alcohol dehydrogenase family)
MSKTAIVTGGSSGIGLSACRELAGAGWRVYELSRHEREDCPAQHINCDVTDWSAINSAVESVYNAEGRIDALICCAGFGVSGAVEFIPEESARSQLDVNFFGMAGACHAVLPYMRRAHRGNIICISSVAAPVAIPFQAYYSASKAAISSLAQALRCEVRDFGIEVCAILPGDIATGFTAARQKTVEGDGEYSGRISRSVATMEKDERGGMPPESIGSVAARLAEKRHLRPLYTVGTKYKFFVLLTHILPARLISFIVRQIYAK